MKRHVLLKPVLSVSLVLSLGLLQFSTVLAQPPNDNFADATVIPGIPYNDEIDTSDATTEANDPDCSGNGPTVWYSFTPPENIDITADTFGSDYDTTLSVYTGTPGNFTQIACNDDAEGELQSRIIFKAEAGETYYFMVGAFANGPGGMLMFNVDESLIPPLVVDFRIDFAHVDPRTGQELTVGGVITCSTPADADVFIAVRQRVGRIFIEGFASTFELLTCDGETAWSFTIEEGSGVFKPGKLAVEAFFFVFTDEQSVNNSVSSTVKLSPRRILNR